MKSNNFLQQFLRNPGQVGAFAASGSRLCRLLAQTAFVRSADVIVEFGTGTGVVTAEIIRQKTAQARLIGIEINEQFAAETRRRCPEAEIVNDSAANAKKILAARGFDGCDCIVSGLPWSIFPDALQDELLDVAFEVLRPGGCFVTFAYLHGTLLPSAQRFFTKLNERFDRVGRTPVIWANIPPALVYLADKGTGTGVPAIKRATSSRRSHSPFTIEESLPALADEAPKAEDGTRSKTVQRIIEAATMLFHDQGYERTSMADIAARARVVPATLEQYAHSKVELLLMALAAEKLDGLADSLSNLDELSPADRVQAYVRRLITHQSLDSDFYIALRDLDESMREGAMAFALEFHERLVEQLAPGRFVKEEKTKRAKHLMMLHPMIALLANPDYRYGLTLDELVAIWSEVVLGWLAPGVVVDPA